MCSSACAQPASVSPALTSIQGLGICRYIQVPFTKGPAGLCVLVPLCWTGIQELEEELGSDSLFTG